MKRFLAVAGAVILASCAGATSSANSTGKSVFAHPETKYVKPVITLEQAKQKIEEYVKGTKEVSQIKVCEGKKYYIGELYLKGYENFDTIRRVYVNKITGDLLPSFAEAKEYCYSVGK